MNPYEAGIEKLKEIGRQAVAINDLDSCYFMSYRVLREVIEAMRDAGKQNQEWKCPHCGKDEGTWFDRTLSGEDMKMATLCNACGMDIDAKPDHIRDDKEMVIVKTSTSGESLTMGNPSDTIQIDRKIASKWLKSQGLGIGVEKWEMIKELQRALKA